MEKAGSATFYATDSEGRKMFIPNYDFLTPQQEKMMATQPDMIQQYAHFLSKELKRQGMKDMSIYADVFVTINGRPNKRLIDSTVDLASQPKTLMPKPWILPSL